MSFISFLSADDALGNLGFGNSDTSIGTAALYALLGICIVVLVLALLVGIFYLSGLLFRTKALGKDNLFERKPRQKESDEQPVSDSDEEDEQVVAAIVAAISCIYESEDGGVKPDFVIRRIKRK